MASLIGLALYDQELWTSTLETPRRYFEQALALRKEINDQKGIVESLLDIGTAHQNKAGRTDEDLERAFEYFQEAYTLAEEGGFRREKAHVARHLGYIYGHHKSQVPEGTFQLEPGISNPWRPPNGIRRLNPKRPLRAYSQAPGL